MFSLVAFEDLGQLNAGDLRAVFGQVPEAQVLAALCGAPPGFRQSLLTKLTASADGRRLVDQIDACGPLPFEAVATAQTALVEALRRLSRTGMVAFDDPEDMVA